MPSLIRAIVPRPIKRRVRHWHQDRTFVRACADLRRDPSAVASDPAAMARLTYGWGNVGYAAREAYLARLIRAAGELTGPGDILECGSGLSTIALAAVASRTGRRVVALEHIGEWARRVRVALARLHLAHAASIVDAPIVVRGECDWYDFHPHEQRFALVVCDGPPSATRGGRYGLLPAVRDHLMPSATILLDDMERADEQTIFARWLRETGASGHVEGEPAPFGVLRLPD